MKRYLLFLSLGIVLVFMTWGWAQEMTVSDTDGNVLMQVNDEGTAGSLTLPQNTAAPGNTADKLYNVNGVLYWNAAQLGTGWTRTGTNVHLSNSGDNVGIGVADPDAKLEVNGQVKITGGSPGADKRLTSDADGLAAWETVHPPKANYIGGDLNFEVTKNYSYYDNPKSVSITVPAGGMILVSATGTVSFESANWDVLLLSILANYEGDPNYDWSAEDNFYDNMTIATDYNCTDATDQYASWSNQRGFIVGSGGTYTYKVWASKYSSAAAISLLDITMFAEYFPN
jgi:hypothetical protein